jgi:hypothetical protein
MMKKWFFAIYIGFFAGLIWGLARELLYYLEFTRVLPAFLVEPFFKKSFMHAAIGHWTGLFVFILFSIMAAILYTALFVKKLGPWPGIGYGIGWWIILYAFIGPYVGMMPSIRELSTATLFSEACVFLLWGVFIGYSIALEFTDEREREPGVA